jgi:cell division protein FtsB
VPKLRWVAVYAIAAFIAAVTIVTFFKEVGRIDRVASSLEARMEELVELTRKNQELGEKITYYRTPEGIAFLAREHFNLVKSGEKIYRIEIVSDDNLRKK